MFAYFRFLSFTPDLTSKSGFWAKALSERHAVHDGLLFFYVDAGGDVHYGLNGESKGVFMQGIDTRSPLWVLLDIYGNSTIVEFLDCRPQLNNNRISRRYVFIDCCRVLKYHNNLWHNAILNKQTYQTPRPTKIYIEILLQYNLIGYFGGTHHAQKHHPTG